MPCEKPRGFDHSAGCKTRIGRFSSFAMLAHVGDREQHTVSTDRTHGASLRQHICALQIRTRSPIPALNTQPLALAACLAIPPDGSNTFQTEGRAVDGRVARPDADRGDCRSRDHA